MKSVIKKLNILALAVGMAAMPSCSDFLIEEPQTSLSIEQVLSDMDNIQSYLDGLYTNLRKCRISREGLRVNHGTDELKVGEAQHNELTKGAFDDFSPLYNSENSYFAELWNLRFPVAVQAAQALYYLEPQLATVEESRKTELESYIGQAAFYEATAYFELTFYWGEIPLTTIADDGSVQLSGRKPLNEVYKKMVDLYTTAINYLPDTRQGNGRIPTSWTAKAMLAKVYMAAETTSDYRRYDLALELLQDIVNNGGFSLMTNYSDLWDPNVNCDKESLWTFYFNNTTDLNYLQWYCGTRAASGWNQRCPFGGYDEAVPTQYAYSTVANGGVWEDGDTRKDASLRYDFTWNGQASSATPGFGDDQLDPHIKKYEDERIVDLDQTFWNCGKNTYYLRYADILLLYAEALNETGNTAEAVNIVNNQVRARAWNWNLPAEMAWNPGMGADEFRTKILDERMRELMGEMWRRYDLLRTGKYVEYTSVRNPWAAESGNMTEAHKRFPIPYTEITQNEFITEADQNPGLK